PAALVVSAASSNQALLPDTGIVLGGSGAGRTVTLTPASGQTGNATVTLTVSDGDLTAQSVFTLTVQMPEPLTLIDNTAPGDTDPASKIPGDGVTTQGSWSGKNTTAGYYGNNYWTDNAAGKGSKSVTYTPRLTASGTYTVQAWWPNTNAAFATNTPIDIIHSGITDTVTVNQQQNGGQWNTLGVYVFTGAGDEYVKIKNDGTDADKHVIADAIQFLPYTEPPPPPPPPEPRLFMDNTAADDTDTASKIPGPGVTTQGNWTGGTSRAGFQGHNYWQDGNTGGSGASTVSKSVTYTPIFPAAGRYMVQMWWPRYATNFATNTPVDIKHNGVTETFSVNQRTGGEMWYSLGIFDFAGAGDEYLKIRNEGADYYVIADAVRFVSVDEQEPFVMSFDKIATNQSSSCRRAFGAGLYDEVSNQTYICWNGPGMSVFVRAYDHATETWGAAQEICHLTYTNQYDYHDYPVLTLAPDGKLLIYFCQHANKLYQLKAPDPHSIAGAWTKTEIGDDLNAYPMPVVAGADIFLFYSKNNDSSWPHRQYRYIKSSDSGATWTAPATIIDTEKTDPQKFDEVYGWGFYYNEGTKRIGLTWTMAGGASHNAAHKGLYFAWFDTTNNNITTVAGASLGGSVVHSELAGCLVNGAIGDHTDPVKGHHYPFTSPQPAFDHISGQPVIAYGYYDPNTGRQSIRCSRWTGAAWVDSIIQQNVKSFSDIRQNGIGELVALYHYSGNILMKSSQDGGVTWEQVSAGAVPFSDGCDKVAELNFLDNIKAPLTAFLGLGFDDTTKPGGYNYDGVFPVYIIKEDIADSPPVFLVHPDAGAGVTGGSQLVLNVAASGKPTPAYQWQVKEGASASWRNLTAADTNYTGIDTDSLTILAAGIGMDGWEFRAAADNGGPPVYGNATTIVILLLPAFDVSPVAEQAAVAGRTLDIAASVSSPTPMTLQWQVNDGSSWRNLTADDTNYSGFNTDTLSILSVTEAMNNWRYRLVAGNALGDNNTNGTTLKVMPADLAAPAALVFDADGNSYVADTGNNRIYQIDSSKNINTLAGAATAGFVDDIGTGARFSAPQGIAIHPTLDALLVADTANAVIRSVTATGTTATFLGPVAGMAAPVGIAFDTAGEMYISDAQKHVIHVLRSGTPGVYAGASGTAGFADDSATGAAARFNTPTGIAFGIDGNLYIADTGNDAVRVILPVDTNDFSVATLAGVAAGISAPRGLAVSGSGPDMRVYLANTGGNNICEIDENGTVTILAGHATGVAGFKDGTGTNAWFDHPEGVTIGADGNLYVADTGNAVIRKITFDSNDQAVVTTQLLATGSSIEPPPIPPDPGNIYDSGRRSGGGAPTVWFSLLAALLIACRSVQTRKKPWASSGCFKNQ
ncbi:MAG: BNR-4 repeat-containing protein, partial [Opitutaceae bacterium]|nr:BNR-4 repeat-containing protein [Opitutaceae bacterium]